MFAEKIKEYINGRIEKHKFIEEMYEFHKYLFEYPELVKNSPIKNITITKEDVIFTFDNEIMIYCDGRDAYSIPLSFLNLSEFETHENAMIYRLIKPGHIVFDIGANIGWYTINILRKHKRISVFSFEPIESSFQYLRKNLLLNKLNTDKAFKIGLSDKNGIEKFYFDIECATASSMANLREDEKTVVVECEIKRLDDFVLSIPALKKLDFIKCDVEGAELFVFKGALETIKKFKPIVFSEMLRKWSKKFGYHPNDIIDLFRGIGYGCYIIDKDKIQEFGYVDDETIPTNYLFFHKQKHEALILELSSIIKK